MEGPAVPVQVEQLLAHREWVRRIARALVGDEHAADDLEQDVWVEALERPPASGRSLGGWFRAALRHNLIDRRRADVARGRREEARARPEAVPSAEELVARADAHKRVVVAVMDLPEPYRSTVLYRFFEDLGPTEVGHRMGVPAETVRTRTRRALDLLRTRLDESEGRGRGAGALVLLLLRCGTRPDRAPPVLPVGVSATATTLALGGLLMSKKAVAATLAVLLLLGLIGVSFFADSEGPGTPEPKQPGLPTASVPPGNTTSVRTEPMVSSSRASGSAAPAAVPSRTLAIQVSDEAGAPVPGVTVRCLLGDGSPFADETAANESGALSLLVPAEAPCRLLARARGFADTESKVAPEYERVLILMRGTRFLEGKAVDAATGRPVAGAKVRTFAGSELNPSRRSWETTTAEDGSFRQGDLPAGNFVLGVGQKAWSGDWDYDEARVGPVPADTRDLRVELVAGPVLAGVVLDDSGMPFRGPFNVSARTLVPGRVDTSYLMTYGPSEGPDAGRFRLRHVEPGLYDIVVSPTGVNADPQPYTTAVLRRVPAGTEGLEARLVRGLTIEGQAFDAEGKPVEDVWVQAFSPTGREPPPMQGGRQGGRFGTELLDPRLDYDILVATLPTDRRGLYAFIKGVRPGTTDLKVVLKGSAPITGTLRDAAGLPVGPGVPVTAQCLDLRYALIGMTVTGYTAADGTFRVPSFYLAGEFRYRLCAGGGGSGFQPVILEGPFRAGQEGIEIRLPSGGETLEGIVRLPGRVLAKKVPMRFTEDPSGCDGQGPPWFVEATTDEKGQFRVANLPSGRVATWVKVEDKEYYCGGFDAPSVGLEILVPLK